MRWRAGLGIGPETIAGSLSISPPDDTFRSAGYIGKFPSAGRTLGADEICGSYVVLDFSFGLAVGLPIAVMLFGWNTPWVR